MQQVTEYAPKMWGHSMVGFVNIIINMRAAGKEIPFLLVFPIGKKIYHCI